MTNQVQIIIDQLAPFFAEQDQKIADRDVEWAFGRVKALKEFKATEEYTLLSKKGAWGGVYDKLFAIAGGKTYYGIFEGRSSSMIEDFMRKNAASISAKRTAKIAKKLTDKGVYSIESAEVAYCTDGFNGSFKINNDSFVIVQSILAGGHTVQRLHQRVLVTVK